MEKEIRKFLFLVTILFFIFFLTIINKASLVFKGVSIFGSYNIVFIIISTIISLLITIYSIKKIFR